MRIGVGSRRGYSEGGQAVSPAPAVAPAWQLKLLSLLVLCVVLPLLASAKNTEWQTYISDDFSGQSAFYQGQSGEAVYSIDKTRYIIDGKKATQDSLSALTDNLYYYYVEAQCQVLETSAGELAFSGLVFHYTKQLEKSRAYYVFYIYGDGYYGAKRVIGDEVQIVIPLSRSAEIDPTHPNVLAVDAQGTRFDLYINGKYVNGFTDVRIDGGGFGFYVSKQTVAAFDNFKVKVERRGGGNKGQEFPESTEDSGGAGGDAGKYPKLDIPKDPNRPTYPWEVGVKHGKGKGKVKPKDTDKGGEKVAPNDKDARGPAKPADDENRGDKGDKGGGQNGDQGGSDRHSPPPQDTNPPPPDDTSPPPDSGPPPDGGARLSSSDADEPQLIRTHHSPADAAADENSFVPDAAPRVDDEAVRTPDKPHENIEQLPGGERLIAQNPPGEKPLYTPPTKVITPSKPAASKNTSSTGKPAASKSASGKASPGKPAAKPATKALASKTPGKTVSKTTASKPSGKLTASKTAPSKPKAGKAPAAKPTPSKPLVAKAPAKAPAKQLSSTDESTVMFVPAKPLRAADDPVPAPASHTAPREPEPVAPTEPERLQASTSPISLTSLGQAADEAIVPTTVKPSSPILQDRMSRLAPPSGEQAQPEPTRAPAPEKQGKPKFVKAAPSDKPAKPAKVRKEKAPKPEKQPKQTKPGVSDPAPRTKAKPTSMLLDTSSMSMAQVSEHERLVQSMREHRNDGSDPASLPEAKRQPDTAKPEAAAPKADKPEPAPKPEKAPKPVKAPKQPKQPKQPKPVMAKATEPDAPSSMKLVAKDPPLSDTSGLNDGVQLPPIDSAAPPKSVKPVVPEPSKPAPEPATPAPAPDEAPTPPVVKPAPAADTPPIVAIKEPPRSAQAWEPASQAPADSGDSADEAATPASVSLLKPDEAEPTKPGKTVKTAKPITPAKPDELTLDPSDSSSTPEPDVAAAPQPVRATVAKPQPPADPSAIGLPTQPPGLELGALQPAQHGPAGGPSGEADPFAGKPGLVRLTDNFSKQRWPVQDNQGSVYAYNGGAYEIDNLKAQNMAISFQDEKLEGVRVDTAVDYVQGASYVGYGCAVRFAVGRDGQVSYYGMFVSHAGECLLLKVEDGKESVLADWKASAGYLADQTNVLRLEATGGYVRAYVNGTLAQQAQDGDLGPGGYALLAGPGVKVRYTNLTLSGLHPSGN